MTKKENKYNLNIEEMAKVGLHFGHKKANVHPNMSPYLYGLRNSIYLINLEKTKEKFEEVLDFIDSLISENKKILVVGTKVQAKEMVKEFAQECELPYVDERWIGGTFTNFSVIKKRIDHFKKMKEDKEKGLFDDHTKKELGDINADLKTFERRFGGIKDLIKIPDAVFIFSMKKDFITVKESRDKGVTVIGVSDADFNPALADYFIPANDDSVDSIKYVLEKIKKVILEAKKKAPKIIAENKSK